MGVHSHQLYTAVTSSSGRNVYRDDNSPEVFSAWHTLCDTFAKRPLYATMIGNEGCAMGRQTWHLLSL